MPSESGVLPNPSHMPRRQPRFEEVDGLRVPLGGKNGYIGVRGKQGRKRDKFQGVTPRKQHRTSPKKTSKEAAVALALAGTSKGQLGMGCESSLDHSA